MFEEIIDHLDNSEKLKTYLHGPEMFLHGAAMLVQLGVQWKLYCMSKRPLPANEAYETLSTNYSVDSSDSF